MHATTNLAEADRLMTVCNSCRYCEGICAVFPALELRQSFADADLNYLANLCHGCGACYFDCQFSPPHDFNVNIPQALARVRGDSYRAYAWPHPLGRAFNEGESSTWVRTIVVAVLFAVGFVAANGPSALFASHNGSGAFYTLMPHWVMATLFGAALLYASVAMALGVRNFLRDTRMPLATLTTPRWLWQAVKDSASLRYLDGGGPGCMNASERPDDRRRLHHHGVAYGFGLCFAATVVATGYHYVVGREAPYAWWDLPVVLGTAGGVGLIYGCIGLLAAKRQRDPVMRDDTRRGMEVAFIGLLLATAVSGLVLLVLRETQAMGVLLAIHLAVVFVLFISMPYGKFVHGLYRFASLVRYAREREEMAHGTA